MSPKFSLQPVLDYRHSRVEVLEVELGRLNDAQKRSQTILEALQSSRSKLFDQLANCQQGELDLTKISQLRSNLSIVSDRITQQQLQVKELERQVREKRAEVIQARQDEEVLATLKEKEAEEYHSQQVQQENRMQDDVYIAQAFRRSARLA
jgi:flagellar export protein FliJ